jgi:hypothetical protein
VISRLFKWVNLYRYNACPQMFCKPCIVILAGRDYLEDVVEIQDEWWGGVQVESSCCTR